jgi:ketosteroid isomerase-like protein
VTRLCGEAVLSDNVGMPFDPEEIRSAERHLVALLEDPDTGKRVTSYTEDAVFMMPGEPPIEGREQMRRRTKTRLYSVSFTPLTTEGNERLASVYALFRCVVDKSESSEGRSVALRILMVWRKEDDGVWRISREFLIPDVPR